MQATAVFTDHRPLLFSIAYRMLGSVSEADDVVQEAWLRWSRAEGVRTPRAWLSSVVTRICLDELKSARARREEYVGTWLPEPLLRDPYAEHTGRPELAESLSMAFLVLLERLTPPQRAAFLLREVFDYDYAEIAGIVDTSVANCRQLVRRAHAHVEAGKARFDADSARKDLLVARFAAACFSGDIDGLEALLAEDATAYSDGGGKVNAARYPVHGAAKIAKFYVGLTRKMLPKGAVSLPARINGQPGLITWSRGEVYGVLVLDAVDGRIAAIRSVLNPDKLRHLPGPGGHLASWLPWSR